MKTYVCKLYGPRPTFPQDMSETEAQAMQRHAAYWRARMEKGGVVAFGPVEAKLGFRFEMHPMPRGAVHPRFVVSGA